MRTLLILTALALATRLSAQSNSCIADIKMPAVGQWAEYKGTMKNDPTTIRYAVVGSEARNGTAMKWMEFRMVGSDPKKSMTFQVLTPGNPAEMDAVEEVIVKNGTNPAMKMNAMMLGLIRGQLGKNSLLAYLCEGVTPGGEESVTVPAGTFTATRYHSTKHNSDSWVVPTRAFVLVKTLGKDFEMSLVASGDGAKSSITETPKEMGK